MEPKLITGEGGYVLEDVPHLSDYLPDLPTFHNPIQDNPAYSVVKLFNIKMVKGVTIFVDKVLVK